MLTPFAKRRPSAGRPALTLAGVFVIAIAYATTSRTSEPSGTLVWESPAAGWGRPAVDATSVYSLTSNRQLIAVDAGSGRPRWSVPTGQGGAGVLGSRAVLHGDDVIVGDYDVLAFRRATGALHWRFTPRQGYGPGIYLGDQLDGAIFAGSPAGRVYAIDARSGAERWSVLVSSEPKTTVFAPVVSGNTLLARYTTFSAAKPGGVVALDARTGTELWRASLPVEGGSTNGGWGGGLTATDSLVVESSSEGIVHAFETTGGTLAWTIPGLDGSLWSATGRTPDSRPLAQAHGRLVVGSFTGQVIAYTVDGRTKREAWRSPPDLGSTLSITADDDLAYIPVASGKMLAVRMSDGHIEWTLGNGDNRFEWPPARHGDIVYLAGTKNLAAYRR